MNKGEGGSKTGSFEQTYFLNDPSTIEYSLKWYCIMMQIKVEVDFFFDHFDVINMINEIVVGLKIYDKRKII